MQHKSKLFSSIQNKGEKKKKKKKNSHNIFILVFNPCNAQKNLEKYLFNY